MNCTIAGTTKSVKAAPFFNKKETRARIAVKDSDKVRNHSDVPHVDKIAKFAHTSVYEELINKLAIGHLEEDQEDLRGKFRARKQLLTEVKAHVSKDNFKDVNYETNRHELDVTAMIQNEIGVMGYDTAKKQLNIKHHVGMEQSSVKESRRKTYVNNNADAVVNRVNREADRVVLAFA